MRLRMCLRYVGACFVLLALAGFALAADSTKAGTLNVSLKFGPNALSDDYYQMAIWLEDTHGKYVETLFVTDATARQGLGNSYIRLFGFTLRSVPGCLPVWAHARNVRYGKSYYPPKDKPLPDAISGATTKAQVFTRAFTLSPEVRQRLTEDKVVCRVELNVARDKIPSMVFAATLDGLSGAPAKLSFVGYGDENGREGSIDEEPISKVRPEAFLSSAEARLQGATRLAKEAQK